MAMMTLAHHQHQQQQQRKMFNVISPPSSNTSTSCVIVSSATSAASIPAGKRPLAPAPERTTSVLVTSNSDLRCKRKIQFLPYGGAPQQPASVARRNARERNRVKQVNNGFATLRQHIPSTVCAALSPAGATAAAASAASSGRGANKKLSKVETLRLAVEYIRSLQQTIEEHDMELTSNAGSEGGYFTTTNVSGRSSTDSSPSPGARFSYMLPTPSCSEASTSPTPSQTSSESFVSAAAAAASSAADYRAHCAADNYENYDPNGTEDDELFDAILSWQEN